MSTIDLPVFKRHLQLTRTVDDAALQDVLDAAEQWVTDNYGPLLGGTADIAVHQTAAGALVLPTPGLTAVTAVTDPTGTPVTVRSSQVNLAAGIVYPPYRRAGAWTVTATRAGSTIPADALLATLIIGKQLWDAQRVTGAPDAPGPPTGFAIPNRARELLDGQRVPATA